MIVNVNKIYPRIKTEYQHMSILKKTVQRQDDRQLFQCWSVKYRNILKPFFSPAGNPLTEKGLGYLMCFQKLRELNISDTNVKVRGFFFHTPEFHANSSSLERRTLEPSGSLQNKQASKETDNYLIFLLRRL